MHDSLLSEYAAMGFEYGYSVARPEALVCWEAQFGDFVNGAQTIIDEFISSGEQKWGQRSGVVLLLPHGYDGQGPDHSSARIERFLTLCAQDNMTVAMPTTPGNYFHLLRWQGLSGRHKPLIVFTPKSMLRLKAAASPVSEFTSGSFRPLIGSTAGPDADVRRVLLCTGKVYYDLAARRQQTGATEVAIVRVERLYPLPVSELSRRAGPLPGRGVRHLGAGGAGQHGRLADLRAQAPAAPGARGGRGVAAAEFRARDRLGGPARRDAHRAHRDRDLPDCTSPTAASRSWRTGGATSRSPWPGWPNGCATSSTSTPASRPPWTAWPPGWPASTTPKTFKTSSSERAVVALPEPRARVGRFVTCGWCPRDRSLACSPC